MSSSRGRPPESSPTCPRRRQPKGEHGLTSEGEFPPATSHSAQFQPPPTTPRGVVLQTGPEPFSLEHTLASGQSFRWRKHGKQFVGVVSKHLIWIEQEGNRLLYWPVPGVFAPEQLKHYLGLDEVHTAALRSFPDDPLLKKALTTFRGMRLLRQAPYETLISFIISSNNNIPRIKKCIENLCRTCGRELSPGCGYYAFPQPGALVRCGLSVLRSQCNLGYRDDLVRQTALRIARRPDLLPSIARLPYSEARKELMKLPGVGPKVADCVLLYSMGKWEAFPIDIRMRTIIQDKYFDGTRVPLSKIRAFAQEHFGPFAGYAQLYLYHYALKTGRHGAPNRSTAS